MNLEQAGGFFSEWNRLHGNPMPGGQLTEWREFFQKLKRLSPIETTAEPGPVFDCERFATFAQAFSKPFDEFRRSGASANVWRVAGLGHDELRNSQVLSWILDKFGEHGQGSAILERLVDLAEKQTVTEISAEMVRNNNYRTRTESLPLGDKDSRVDIEIESSAFLIFIEVKIRARETGDQLRRYFDIALTKAAKRPFVVIFLTPDGRIPGNEQLHGKIVSICWKQIANILATHSSGDLANDFSGYLFRQFAEHIRGH